MIRKFKWLLSQGGVGTLAWTSAKIGLISLVLLLSVFISAAFLLAAVGGDPGDLPVYAESFWFPVLWAQFSATAALALVSTVDVPFDPECNTPEAFWKEEAEGIRVELQNSDRDLSLSLDRIKYLEERCRGLEKRIGDE